jgi:hypothetical protein
VRSKSNEDALRTAARAKSEKKTAAALAAIRKLNKAGLPVTFQSVQRQANVSHTFLYRSPDIRARIEHLRSSAERPTTAATPKPMSEADNVVVSLQRTIQQLRGDHRSEVQALKTALERTHGENLALRRRLVAAGIDPGEDHSGAAS